MIVRRLREKFIDQNPKLQEPRPAKLPPIRTLDPTDETVNFESVSQPELVNPQRVSILAWLQLEVTKYLQSNRLSEQGLRELETKLQTEIYLRDKKEAILEDRHNLDVDAVDIESNLERVQKQLPALAQTIDDTKSQRSAVSCARNSVAKSIAALSTV